MNKTQTVKNIIKLNSFNISLAFAVALLAAALTVVFALTSGVSSLRTVFARGAFSFCLFAITGFLAVKFLLVEYGQALVDEPVQTPPERKEDLPPGMGASFDKIVVVNSDEE